MKVDLLSSIPAARTPEPRNSGESNELPNHSIEGEGKEGGDFELLVRKAAGEGQERSRPGEKRAADEKIEREEPPLPASGNPLPQESWSDRTLGAREKALESRKSPVIDGLQRTAVKKVASGEPGKSPENGLVAVEGKNGEKVSATDSMAGAATDDDGELVVLRQASKTGSGESHETGTARVTEGSTGLRIRQAAVEAAGKEALRPLQREDSQESTSLAGSSEKRLEELSSLEEPVPQDPAETALARMRARASQHPGGEARQWGMGERKSSLEAGLVSQSMQQATQPRGDSGVPAMAAVLAQVKEAGGADGEKPVMEKISFTDSLQAAGLAESSLTRREAAPPAHSNSIPVATREAEIRAQVGQEAWEKSMARHVLDSVREGAQQVRLRLHPDSLGHIEVQVRHEEGGARIQFTTQHALVKEAMEAALPRLRDLFHGSGMNLLEASVSRHGGQEAGQQGHDSQAGNFQQGSGSNGHSQEGAVATPSALTVEEAPAQVPGGIPRQDGNGGIDYYI